MKEVAETAQSDSSRAENSHMAGQAGKATPKVCRQPWQLKELVVVVILGANLLMADIARLSDSGPISSRCQMPGSRASRGHPYGGGGGHPE